MMTPKRRTQRVDALGVRKNVSEYVSKWVSENASKWQRTAACHNEFAMRRNSIAKPSCHWNSRITRNCYRRRILYKHNQHRPCSVLDTARYQILHPMRYTSNILPALSISSLRNELEIVLQCHNDSRRLGKPQTEFRIRTINSEYQNQVPNTKIPNAIISKN